jgi:hypothetical protein
MEPVVSLLHSQDSATGPYSIRTNPVRNLTSYFFNIFLMLFSCLCLRFREIQFDKF